MVVLGTVFLLAWVAGGRPVPNPAGNPAPWLETLVAIVSYGVAGAGPIDRRPDLPLG